MRIGVDARVLEGRVTGIGRYLSNILKNIQVIDSKNEYFLFSYRGASFPESERIKNIPTFPFLPTGVLRKVISPFWLNFVLPSYLAKYRVDLFFSPNHFLPLRKLKAKTVVTIHDLFPKVDKRLHPLYYNIYANIFLGLSIIRSDAIIVDSQSTKKDVLKFYKIPPGKVSIIYLAADDKFHSKNVSEERRREILEKYRIPAKFFVYIGVLEKRKNIDGLIKIADLLKNKTEIPIVLFGNARHGRRYLREFEQRSNIFYRGFIDDSDLVDIYNLATAFVFPSLYEGFGLPVLEAIKSGLPVVTSDSSSLPEVVGEAALTCSPEDYKCFVDNLLELSSKQDLWDQYKDAGLRQASGFSWRKTAEETVNLFNSIGQHNSEN